MKAKTCFDITVVAVALLLSSSSLAQTRRSRITQSKYPAVTEYDPKRDAARDIIDAVKEAQRTHRNVLLEVGGEWCSWCHRMDAFFKANPELLQLRDKNFVTLKINYSEDNENKQVLSRYPPINGYPHIFFLDSRGKLLFSQDTGLLEKGPSYDLEKLRTALTKWGSAK